MERKKTILIITFLVMIIIGLVFYICYDKGIIFSKDKGKENLPENKEEQKDKSENKNDEKTDEPEKWEDIALDDPSFYQLYKTLKEFTYEKSRGAGYEDFTNQELADLAFGIAKVEKSDFTEISRNEEFGSIKKSFSADVITGEINKLFGTKVPIDFSKIKEISGTYFENPEVYKVNEDSCMIYIESYDASSKMIVADFSTGCGGAFVGPWPNGVESKIVSAQKNKNTIKVEEKIIYWKVDSTSNNTEKESYFIYSDDDQKNIIDQVEFNTNELEFHDKKLSLCLFACPPIDINSYLNKASTITHIYKLNPETNQYYFVKSTIS